MISAENELILLIFLLYAVECIYFLRPDQVAYTGVLKMRFRKWEHMPSAYTLLGRHLCVVSLFKLDSGIAIFPGADPIENTPGSKRAIKAAMKKVEPTLTQLRVLCTAFGLGLLLVLPVMAYWHLLSRVYVPLTIDLLLLHVATSIVFTMELRRWEKDSRARISKPLAVFLNPISAIRCIDVLSRTLFEALRRGDL